MECMDMKKTTENDYYSCIYNIVRIIISLYVFLYMLFNEVLTSYGMREDPPMV